MASKHEMSGSPTDRLGVVAGFDPAARQAAMATLARQSHQPVLATGVAVNPKSWFPGGIGAHEVAGFDPDSRATLLGRMKPQVRSEVVAATVSVPAQPLAAPYQRLGDFLMEQAAHHHGVQIDGHGHDDAGVAAH